MRASYIDWMMAFSFRFLKIADTEHLRCLAWDHIASGAQSAKDNQSEGMDAPSRPYIINYIARSVRWATCQRHVVRTVLVAGASGIAVPPRKEGS